MRDDGRYTTVAEDNDYYITYDSVGLFRVYSKPCGEFVEAVRYEVVSDDDAMLFATGYLEELPDD